MGARVPVLKYKCALSGLDCDISIQGSAALLKANIMAILNQHCPMLSPLYRCACAVEQYRVCQRKRERERESCASLLIVCVLRVCVTAVQVCRRLLLC
jgi:hypothetical protein